MKESYSALIVFFVESIRRNIDIESLKSVLSEHKLNEKRIEKILELYLKHKLEVQTALQQFNSDPPNLLGVSWKLNYCVKVCLVFSSYFSFWLCLMYSMVNEYVNVCSPLFLILKGSVFTSLNYKWTKRIIIQ